MRLTPEIFEFLDELKVNNNRDWFAQNKQRYEDEVRTPLLQFIEAFEPNLASISPYFLALAKKSGGSMFRIHRDVRFSKDKSPYKTNAALHFRHENGKDAHAPGFYLHLQRGECFCGAGIWRPDSSSLRAIRERIVEHPEEWKQVSQGPFERQGDSLKRVPRGFDPEHSLVLDLKRKDHVAVVSLNDRDLVEKKFLDRYTKICQEMAPYVGFLCKALDQPF